MEGGKEGKKERKVVFLSKWYLTKNCIQHCKGYVTDQRKQKTLLMEIYLYESEEREIEKKEGYQYEHREEEILELVLLFTQFLYKYVCMYDL